MKFSQLIEGMEYIYPPDIKFDDYRGVWKKLPPIPDARYSFDWQAVCVYGKNLGQLVSHENDPLWDQCEVTVIL